MNWFAAAILGIVQGLTEFLPVSSTAHLLLGARMLGMALEMAGEHGIRRAELIVRSDNIAAIDLYRRFGFLVEGTLRQYMLVDGVSYDALLMARLNGWPV